MAYGGVLVLSLAVAAYLFLLMRRRVRIWNERLGKRLLGLAPTSGKIGFDASGLSVGDRVLPWVGGHWDKQISCRAHWIAEFKEFPKHPIMNGVKPFSVDDGWLFHNRFVPAEKGVRYPRCVAGKRACPPDDVGGIWSYADFVAAVTNRRHKRRKELLAWSGPFDSEAFDADLATRSMHKGLPDWRLWI